MPPVISNERRSLTFFPPFSKVTAPAPETEGMLNEKACGEPDVRLAEAAEEDAQHRLRVGRRSDRRAGVRSHPLLVDDDRRADVLECVDLGTVQLAHELLHERRDRSR